MKHKRKRSLLSMLLILALALSVSAVRTIAAEPLDLEAPIALTLRGWTDSYEYAEDIATAHVTFDLYKIADAVADEDHGSTYVFTKPLVSLGEADITSYEGLSALGSSDWQTLAQTAAAAVLLQGGEVAAAPALTAETDLSALSAGLYLVIARGSDLDIDDYVVVEDGAVSTVANSRTYVYSYDPELIALPTTVETMGESGAHEEVSTAGGEWSYALTAYLKPHQSDRLGDLFITKTLENYEPSTPATFVFSVQATLDGENVLDDVVSLTFTGPGTQTYELIGRIPVGASVVVEEIYSGACYSLTSAARQEAVIVAPEADPESESGETLHATVSFSNAYDRRLQNGYGILNEFTYDGEDWQWGGAGNAAQGGTEA